jgi:phage terminase Nu1 subunit (DNA packaging protein)
LFRAIFESAGWPPLIAPGLALRSEIQQQCASQASEHHGARLRDLMERLLDIRHTNQLTRERSDGDVLGDKQLLLARVDIKVVSSLRERIAQIEQI